jgi:hypothetical protein
MVNIPNKMIGLLPIFITNNPTTGEKSITDNEYIENTYPSKLVSAPFALN